MFVDICGYLIYWTTVVAHFWKSKI